MPPAMQVACDASVGPKLMSEQMRESFVDRFASVSGDYAAFRPTYPHALIDWLASIASERSLAWDCATGSGQAAVDLAARFERVIATDASADQIAKAASHPRIEYRVAPAEESGIATGSVDLITVAQALHWFDVDRFFLECERVLKPGGVLAVWTYGPLHVQGESVDAIVQRFYHDIAGPYWPVERALVDSGYQSIKLPYPELEVPAFEMTAFWSLKALLGYLGTWSSTTAYRETTGEDPRDLIGESLAQAWGDTTATRQVVWPLVVRAGRKGSVQQGVRP